MATDGLSNRAEEWIWKTCFRQDRIGTRDTAIDVLLYNDASDALDDTSDVGDITTEPNDGNYTRQTLSLDSSDLRVKVVGGEVRVAGDVTFDVANTTGTVDAWAAVVEFKSDIVDSETSQNPHLLASSPMAKSLDLGNYESRSVGIRFGLN